MVVKNTNIHNIMGGMESTGGVRLHNHRRKLKQRFDIIRKLGQGTYGKVQLGINKETGQEVAIKTIKKAKIETEADLIRIRREIQIMSSVQHPNIIHIYEVFENREKMVLVMEYAAGGELYDFLSERKVLSQDEARRIFRQIATAVFYCHKHKICHRDLKLENILLDEHGSAKIADFGLSNVFDEQRLLNTFCGSPLYASPEIVKGTPYHGPEVDCWSLGVLLYTLVYGAMPFDGSNFKRLVKQISQGDYFEPKKPSPASSLIRDMLTVSPARRADIEKVCSHWWVNEGYSDSCLQIAEELADQTPVRLDLLLSLAPPPSGVGTDNIMQQGLNNTPSVPHAMVPTRCHSVGSLMELDHTATEQLPQRVLGAVGKQSLYGDSGANSAQSMTSAVPGHWDSTKRKLEEGASSSEVNLRGAVKRDRGKRKSCEESFDAISSPGRTKLPTESESQEKASPKQEQEEEKMDIEEISDFSISGVAHLPESTESSLASKDSGVETQDVVNSSGEVEPVCKSSTVSSTATIMPADDFSSTALSSPDDQVPKESPLSDINSNKNKKSIKKKHDIVNEDSLKDQEKPQTEGSEKKDSNLVKEPQKSNDTKQKHKKNSNTETNDMSKSSKISATKNIDSGSASSKTSKVIDCAANSLENSNAPPEVKDGKENEVPNLSAKSVKSKGDLVLENLNTDTPFVSSISEPSTPPATTIERRRSKIFETADKFNNIMSGTQDAKGVAREKPKKLFIPGVKVSDFKKAFERKLSSPEISVSSFSKKGPTKSDDATSEKLEKTQNHENSFNAMQKIISPGNETIDNSKIKTVGTGEDDQLYDNLKGKKTKSPGKISTQLLTDDGKKQNVIDSNKSKSIKIPTEVKKNSKPMTSSKSLDSAPEGMILENSQSEFKEIAIPSTDTNAKAEISNKQEISCSEKSGQQAETTVGTPEGGNEVTSKSPSKPNDPAVKKKSSKVEITLKSATLPRRKTSKAEIKLDPAIPPIEYKTEIEHMISAPTTLPLSSRQLEDEQAVPDITPHFRSWSLEPESTHLGKMSSRECIIPIQIEREGRENANLTSPPVGRPPVHPFQQRSMSQSQRSSTLSRQSTQESDSEVMEPIRKSPREYIIPIAVEGGGYVTPRAGSLEPSASDDTKSKPRSIASSSRSNHYRRMSSLLSDTSEDEGFNMSPVGLQRHGSLNRGRDDSRTFHFHRLRSSRPMRHSLEHNDSLSSAEEDDDDDDDEGFEILTAESLFSTLLSRVRSLTQRLTVEDGKRPGFPSNHFVNQLTNISHPSTSFKNIYGRNREPLSRRLSETSSFPRLLNRGGDFGSMHQRSLSRDSSKCDSMNSEGSCSVGAFPRGSAIQKFSPSENVRRGARNSSLYQYGSGIPKGVGWQTKSSDEPYSNNPYLTSESSVRKVSSNGKHECKSPSHCRQSHPYNSPWKLSRTLSLRSTSEGKSICSSPLEENTFNKYSLGHGNDRHNQNIDLPADKTSSLPISHKREKLRSPVCQNATSFSRDFKSQDYLSGHVLPPLPQSPLSEIKGNSIPRPFHTLSRIQGQELGNKHLRGKRSASIDCYYQHPKHSSSLPSIVEGPKSNKYLGKFGNSNLQLNQSESHRTFNNAASGSNVPNKQLNNTENIESSFVYNNGQFSENARPDECGMQLPENSCDKAEATKCKQIISSQNKHLELMTSRSQSHSPKSEKHSLIPKSSSNLKQEIGSANVSTSESTDKDDAQGVQKRRISRFLRPDFFDTPPEESTYVKEREARKAAEAEIKKARRLARRTSSMRETPIPKTEAQNNSSIDGSEHTTPVIKHGNHKSLNTSKTKTDITNVENHNERKSNSKRSTSLLSLSEDKNYQKTLWSSTQKGDSSGTPGSGLCATAKSRIGKAISSLQEHNFTPWDKKVVATESTYLKRAVSVDDVSLKSQGSLSKSNPKLGRKISSVLGLFSKLDSPSMENQHLQNVSQSQSDGGTDRNNYDKTCALNEQKLHSSASSSEKAENKLEEKKKSFGSNMTSNTQDNETKVTKQFKSLKDSKPKQEIRKNKKVAAQVISDAICNTKEPKKKIPLSKRNPTNLMSENVLPQKVQQQVHVLCSEQGLSKNPLPSNLQQSQPKHVEGVSDTNKIMPATMYLPLVNETCEKSSLDSLKEITLPNAHDLGDLPKLSKEHSENSPADETESVGSGCACSDTDGQEHLTPVPGDDDDDDKESESVEDRIRRKSFYTRFNDVKKKGRKKSSQFLKECRTSLLPIHHKNNENQSFLSQAGNTGVKNKKASTATEVLDMLGDANSDPSQNCFQNSLFDTCKNNEFCESSIKNMNCANENRISDNLAIEVNEMPVGTCALLRPAAFAQGVLNKASPVKAKVQTLLEEESTSIPKPLETVSTTSAVVADENYIKKGSTS